jgi:hypothetical protein
VKIPGHGRRGKHLWKREGALTSSLWLIVMILAVIVFAVIR